MAEVAQHADVLQVSSEIEDNGIEAVLARGGFGAAIGKAMEAHNGSKRTYSGLVRILVMTR